MTVTKCIRGLVVLMLVSLSVVWAQSSAGPAGAPAAPVTGPSTDEKAPAAAPAEASTEAPVLPGPSVPARRSPAATTPPANSTPQPSSDRRPQRQEPAVSGDLVTTDSRMVDGYGNETHSLRLNRSAGQAIGVYRELNKRLDEINKQLDAETKGQVQMAVDSRTNSIIIRGRPEQVDAVKKIIAELGFQTSAEPAATTDPQTPAMVAGPQPAVTYPRILLQGLSSLASASAVPASPARTYQLAEQEAAEAAREYRQGAEQKGPDHPTQKALRDRVASLVEKAFDLRQALRESARRVWQAERSRDALKESDTAENLSRNSEYQRVLLELRRNQEEHAELLQEAKANLQLLQLDLDSATAALQAAEQELDIYRKNVERGVVPTSGVAPLDAKAKQAANSVERARILLDLHRQAIQDASLERARTGSPQPTPESARPVYPFEDESF